MKSNGSTRGQRKRSQRTRRLTDAPEAQLDPHIRLAIRTGAHECGVPVDEIIAGIGQGLVDKAFPGFLNVHFDQATRTRIDHCAKAIHLTAAEFLGLMAMEGVRQIEASGHVVLTNLSSFSAPCIISRGNKTTIKAGG